MFGFLFKRKKSIDKDRQKSSKNRKEVDSGRGSSNTLPSTISASSVNQSAQGGSSITGDDKDLSLSTSSPELSFSIDSRKEVSLDLSDADDRRGRICDGESEPSLKYFSLTDLSKGVEFIDDVEEEVDGFSNPQLENQEKEEKFKLETRKSKGVDQCVELADALKRDLSEAERNAMVELDEIRSKILAKDTEISLLHADVNMLSADRDNRIVQIEDLTCQLRRIQEENETSLATVQSIETELASLREKNSQLTSDLLKKSEELSRKSESTVTDEKAGKELQLRLKGLEKKVEGLELEKKKLTEEHESVEVEREEELRALQNALDDALEEKIKLQNKFDHDFEGLRTAFSSQENQLMDDFEWKLRQIESTCKKKLQDKDRQADEKLKEVRGELGKELAEEKERVRLDRIQVDEQMRQVSHFKSYEAELIQLRGLTHEQQKCMRSASRQIEHLKFSEKLVRDDLRTLKIVLDKEKSNMVAAHNSHQRRLEAQEENIHLQLDKQRNELNAKFEERMKAECSRLKQDLCKEHTEEKHLAVESTRLSKDQEISSARENWEKQKKELLQEISKLKETIMEKESWCSRELEKLTTKADKEKWELRRQIEKESLAHAEQVTEIKENYTEELDSLREQYEEVASRLKEVEKKLLDAEAKNNSLMKFGVVTAPAVTNGKSSPTPITNPVNKSDSGCGDDVSEEEEDDDEEEDEDDESEEEEEDNVVGLVKKSTPTNDDNSSCSENVEETVVHSLREEVATLQGSIEKLTSTLATEGQPKTSASSDRASSSEEEETTSTSTSGSDDDDE